MALDILIGRRGPLLLLLLFCLLLLHDLRDGRHDLLLLLLLVLFLGAKVAVVVPAPWP